MVDCLNLDVLYDLLLCSMAVDTVFVKQSACVCLTTS